MWSLTWPILWAFISAIILPAARILLKALGIGGVTFIGLTVLLSSVKDAFINLVGGLPADIAQILALLGFFEAISLFFSALTVRLVLMGVNDNILNAWGEARNPSGGGIFGA